MRSHTPIKRKKQSTQHKTKSWTACFILSSLALLFTLWLIAVSCIITTISSSNDTILSVDDEGNSNSIAAVKSSLQSSLLRYKQQLHLSSSNNVVAIAPDSTANSNTENTKTNTLQQSKSTQSNNTPQSITPKLLSRHTNITITSSTRGNLGPPTVLNQNPPGTDWLKDRWQAASDMHGTAIRGSHWVLFDFTPWLDHDYSNGYEIDVLGDGRRGIVLSKIVLDWETAYANDYRVEVRINPIENDGSGGRDDWCVLYDNGGGNQHFNNNESAQPQFHESSYGQSPGVKQKLPLHIIHTIEWPSPEQQSSSNNNEQCQSTTAFRYLRVFIRRPARGWGVSLWEVDVYGSVVSR